MRVELTLFLGLHEPALVDSTSDERWVLNQATSVTLAVGFPPHHPDRHPAHWRKIRGDFQAFFYWWDRLPGGRPTRGIRP